MDEELSENSASNSEKEEECINSNEKLLNANHEYVDRVAPIQNRLAYEAIGEKYEIELSSLMIIQAIGNGYFSDVYMGMLSLPTGKVPVAVKKPQTDTGAMNAVQSEAILKRQRQALRDELSIFAHLQSSSTEGHENVLKLLGAITIIKTDFSLLTEYCECGSMDRFLQKKWENGNFEDELVFETNENEQVWKNQRDSSWGDNYQSRREKGLITTSDLLWFALQIARGMQFLAAMNVMHRDIAVRNVLLKLDFTVKVADFGLSRKLKESDNAYYTGKEGTALPIRYIAPESLKSGRFAITSEYWSFGVVVWELFTFAEKQPYSVEFDNYENNGHFYEFLVEHLSSGHRLLIPDNVPQQITSLLSKLWDSDSKRRSSFQVCKKVIRQELMQSCPNILLKEKAPHHASEYSLFRFDVEDVNEGTTTGERKKLQRRIIVGVAILAVVLIAALTALIFILLNKSHPQNKNVTPNPNSTILEDPFLLQIFKTLCRSVYAFRQTIRNLTAFFSALALVLDSTTVVT
uniref:Protein kinase domain-containing protein n=1 Tax=Plectus sambesii TaxID=2011161 RepID=A0A914XCQ5_9BILA